MQPSKFKDQIDFIQGFVNQAASHLVNRKDPQGAVWNSSPP